MKQNNSVTIQDVAQRAGCSPALVCTALSGKGRVSVETKNRILAIADEMGYVPNRAAQSLSRKTITIGVVIPRAPSEVQDLLRDNLIAVFEQEGLQRCRCLMLQYDAFEASKLQALQAIDDDVDGVVLEMKEPESPALTQALMQLVKKNKPIVGLVTAPSLVPTIGLVSVDTDIIAGLAAQMLKMSGCAQVGVVAGEQDSEFHMRVLHAFEKCCQIEGLAFQSVVFTDDLPEQAYLLTKKMLSESSLQGIFVTSYCSPAVCRAVNECGYADSIKVIGVDLYDQIRQLLKSDCLTATIYQNQPDQARTAGRYLLDYILHQTDQKQLCIQPGLVLRSNADSY